MSTPPTTAEQAAGISWANEVTHAAEATVPLPPAGSAEADAGGTAPALKPPAWSGRKTAIAAALAVGLSTAGALGAAAADRPGSVATDQGQFQPGGFGRGQRGPGGFGGQLPASTT